MNIPNELNKEIDKMVVELMKLKDKGEVDHVAISYGVDRQRVHIEIVLVRHGVEKKISSLFAKDNEGISASVIGKVNFVIRSIN